MTNRPAIHPLGNFVYPNFSSSKLSNQIPVKFIEVDLKDLVFIDFAFLVGSVHQKHFFVNNFVKKMLLEGTSKHSSKQISEFFDFHATSMRVFEKRHLTIIGFSILRKYLPQVLPLISEIFSDPLFPESEFELKRKSFRQSFEVQESTVDTMATRGLYRCIYGDDGTFGRIPLLSDIDNLQLDWVKEFYHKNYRFENMRIYISGKISDSDFKMIDDIFGTVPLSNDFVKPQYDYVENPHKDHELFIPKADSVQSSIRIGCRVFQMNDPSDDGFTVLDYVLGGYFGSRLMKNIREEKGFTYGISSGKTDIANDAIWSVSTEADSQYVKPLLDEVYHEIELLQNELIPEDELTQVRNYGSGLMLRITEQPLTLIQCYEGYDLFNLNFTEIHKRRSEAFRSVSAEELRDLAQKYLQKQSLYQVVAGKM